MEDGRTRPGAGRHLTSVDRPRHRRRRPTRAQLLHRVDVLALALAELRAELVEYDPAVNAGAVHLVAELDLP